MKILIRWGNIRTIPAVPPLPLIPPFQAFRIIAEALNCAGFVPTLDIYKQIIREAWQGEQQHVEFVEAVHDYKKFVEPHVWETKGSKDEAKGVLTGLTTAR